MLFGSFRFLLGSLPIALAGFDLPGAVGRRREAALWLALASFAFYIWGDPVRNLAVLSASTAVNFLIGRSLGRRPDARLGLTWPLPGIRLPIGISFFAFTQVAFLVDGHRGLARETGAAIGLGLLTKATFLPLLAAAGLILLARTWRSRRGEPAGHLLGTALYAAAALGIAGWWYAGQVLTTGDPIGANDGANLAGGEGSGAACGIT